MGYILSITPPSPLVLWTSSLIFLVTLDSKATTISHNMTRKLLLRTRQRESWQKSIRRRKSDKHGSDWARDLQLQSPHGVENCSPTWASCWPCIMPVTASHDSGDSSDCECKVWSARIESEWGSRNYTEAEGRSRRWVAARGKKTVRLCIADCFWRQCSAMFFASCTEQTSQFFGPALCCDRDGSVLELVWGTEVR
jgi:hypothetical protein